MNGQVFQEKIIRLANKAGWEHDDIFDFMADFLNERDLATEFLESMTDEIEELSEIADELDEILDEDEENESRIEEED